MIEKSLYFQYLQPGPNDQVEERVNDFMWFDENQILCSVPKENPIHLTKAEVMTQAAEFVKIYGDEKTLMISVVNPHVKSTKEERDLISELLPKYILALAVINLSALGRMAINLYIGLKPPPFPLKVFKTAQEGKEWLLSLNLKNE